MDDALRWYVKRTESIDDEELIKQRMQELRERHSFKHMAALIAFFLQFRTTNVEEVTI